MEYRRLGRTDLDVSVICLGTMTWGEQNSEAEAHEQLDYALSRGVNFIDTAELYPVPPKAETQGRTESHIGSWMKARGARDKVILATKVVGRSDMEWFRGEKARLSAAHINQAVDASLKRLGTDYIDLYQIHWPERKGNFFGKLGYEHDPNDDPLPIEETLEAMAALVKSGKVRHIGLSNETAWGAMHYLHLSETKGLPRAASIQNPYSLLNRSFEVGLAEVAIREDCGLLAYSPLGMGALSGKYLNGARPAGARMTIFERFQRYNTPRADREVAKYVEVAKKHGLDPAQMALAFVNDRAFVTANIIGATSMAQLESNIDSIDLKLSREVLDDIEAIHIDTPYPCP